MNNEDPYMFKTDYTAGKAYGLGPLNERPVSGPPDNQQLPHKTFH
jgi:hypothetical protein